MAATIVNRGLLRIGQQASESTNYNAARNIQTLAVDDSSTAATPTTTTLGSPSNLYDLAFDSTPTESGQEITHVATIPTGSGNFTIRRVSLHDDTAANVTGSSTTLVAMIDGQTLTKTSDFSMQITMRIAYTDQS